MSAGGGIRTHNSLLGDGGFKDRCVFPVPPHPHNPQGAGSAIAALPAFMFWWSSDSVYLQHSTIPLDHAGKISQFTLVTRGGRIDLKTLPLDRVEAIND
jgi:hypothetical protein